MRVTIFSIFPAELTILILQQLLQEKTKISHRWCGDEMEQRMPGRVMTTAPRLGRETRLYAFGRCMESAAVQIRTEHNGFHG
jgi:hypothetical protein